MQEGERWLVAVDVCNVLEIAPTATCRLDEDEKNGPALNAGYSGERGGAQLINVVNESGLYTLVLGACKTKAKQINC